MLLEGKVAVVAGVGPGLGREAALAMAREGADVVLTARTETVARETAAAVVALGRRAVVVTGDVSDEAHCHRVAETAEDELGRIDVLLYNAFSQGVPGPLLDADLDTWREAYDVNVLGAVALTRAVVPAMERRGDGRVIITNSMQAYKVVDGFGAYSVSKGALVVAMRTLAAELGPRGIRVNGIHPGLIMGDSVRGYFARLAEAEGVSPDEVYRRHAAESALRYIPDAAEMAGTVVFLASDLARPITGQSIGINAGAWFH